MQQARKSDVMLYAIGAVCAGFGLYIVLAGLGALPPPGEAHAPPWLLAVAGLTFLLAGVNVLIRAATGTPDSQGALAAGAPGFARALYRFTGFGIIVALGTIGSWVAFGPGPREFTGTLPIAGQIGAYVGRAAFGLGAAVIWIVVVGMTISFLKRTWRDLKARQ